MNHQLCLQRLATGHYRNKEEAAQLLVELADACWHKNAQLSLDEFEGERLQKAAYVLELLAGFSPFYDAEQAGMVAASLHNALVKLKERKPVTFYCMDSPSRYGFDDVAKKWGLTAGASPRKIPGFLDLQRRSYMGSSGTVVHSS